VEFEVFLNYGMLVIIVGIISMHVCWLGVPRYVALCWRWIRCRACGFGWLRCRCKSYDLAWGLD